MTEPNKGPLAGVRVIDMTSVLFGAFTSQILGDLGADVIKVESPNEGGDIFRYTGKPVKTKGMGPIFMHFNRNKRSVLLDLKKPEDAAVMRDLLKEADMFITNVRMASLQKIGLDYDAVKAIKSDSIYLHCAGFGAGGPYEKRQAYDDLIQAASGVTDLMSQVDQDPTPRYLPTLMADKSSGLFAAYAAMAALYHKERTGRGQFVEVPMFECSTYFNMTENMYGHTFQPPTSSYGYSRVFNKNRHPYKTKDGYLAILPYTDEQWDSFFELGGMGAGMFTKNPKFSTYSKRTENIEEVYGLIKQVALTRTTDEWCTLLDEHNVPCMKVNKLEEVMSDPHLSAVKLFEKRNHPSEGEYISIRHPVIFSDSPASVRRDPPLLGEHTQEIKDEVRKLD